MENQLTQAKTLFASYKAVDRTASEKLKKALNHLFDLSKQEAGMIQYEVFQSQTNELEFYVMETWSNESALQRHLNQPHLQKFVELCQTVLAEPFSAIAMKSPLATEWFRNQFAHTIGIN